ncbi:MAG: rod shape-determining protein RodA [Tannerella sp.]|jgi:rod shape determining protein RodA|nr:rod shape-determining protein RodA [Tannerella sp.]
MYNRNTSVWQSVDWYTIGIYVLMVVAGWFTIYGASYEFDSENMFNPSGRMGSQLIWIGTSFLWVFILLMLDKDFFETFSFPIYAVVFLLLAVTIVFAPEIKGSRSWLIVGPIHIQPAEFAKFATALALAKFMHGYNFNLFTFKNFVIVTGLILVPMICILLQKETGSALVYLAFVLVLYREGMSGFILLASVCAVAFFVIVIKCGDEMIDATPVGELIVATLILAITLLLSLLFRRNKTVVKVILCMVVFALLAGFITSLYIPVNYVWVIVGITGAVVCYLIFISLKNLIWSYLLIALFALMSVGFLFSVNYVFDDMLERHQQMRIKVALGLEDDPGGAGYNVNQSKIAIGSGGFTGKGFLNGTQTKLKYVPEQDTDFIFCTVGEEFGFIGSAAVLLLFGALIMRLIFLSERQDTVFGRVYGYSVASIFFFHLAINIGMVLGLTPVIGIPLPFFSYGGSSLWGFTILLFIFLRIDAGRKERYN